jgi:hypothetical protein
MAFIASTMATKCSKNFDAMSSYSGSSTANSNAIESIVPQ